MPEKAAGKESSPAIWCRRCVAKVLALPEQKAAGVIRLAVSELE
jgi:hypothetical protein